MKLAIAIMGLAALSTPALALTEPQPLKKSEPRMLAAPYVTGDIVALHLMVGKMTTVQFPPGLSNMMAWTSDDKQALDPKVFGNSVVVFKPAVAFTPQPVAIYAVDSSGKAHVYNFEADAVNSNSGDQQAFNIKITDPVADHAAQVAAWQRSQAAIKEIEARELLNTPPAKPPINTDYTARGATAMVNGGH